MADLMDEKDELQKSEPGQSTRRRVLLIGIAVCVSWYVLAWISSAPSYYIANANAAFEIGGVKYQTLTHILRLAGGVLLVVALWPGILRKYYESYRDYLRELGVFMPQDRQMWIVLLVFGVVFAGLFVYDLVPSGFTGIVEFHRGNPLWFIFLTAFQAAIVEELVFRGLAFGVLRKRFPLWVAVLLPAIFFGFAHMYWGIGRVFVTALVGALLALLRWRTDNIWGPILVHGFVNVGFPIPVWGAWLAAMLTAIVLLVIRRLSKRLENGTGS
ncbi:MAG TPA: CPBP family intramembrane metalloprotease [Anaerolineae bacterium]|nr:CPBP family intramembrane metalloprotease [Anaerolineae bacterium]